MRVGKKEIMRELRMGELNEYVSIFGFLTQKRI